MFKAIKKHKIATFTWLLALVVAIGFGVYMYMLQQGRDTSSAPRTSTVTKTTLTQIVSASGQVASTGQVAATTKASGTVGKVYVQAGSAVNKGDKIMDIEPDAATIQTRNAAWASYLAAKNVLEQAKAKLHTLDAAVIAAELKLANDATDKGLDGNAPLYQQLYNALLAARADRANQQGVIAQAQAAANNTYSEYQQTSTTVLAPASGTIQDLSFAQGAYIASSSGGTSGGTTSVAVLKITNKLTATINVSELDIASVAVGQNVTLTLTALADKTFQGKVLSIASSGSTESNITTFPITVEIVEPSAQIRVGMAINGDITVQSKENVLAVPNQAIVSAGGKHEVTVVSQDGTQKKVTVSVGLILDTQSEITNGLAEGDKVIISGASDDSETSDTEARPGRL